MEGAWELPSDPDARRRPLYALAALVAATAIVLVFAEGLFSVSFGSGPLICAGALVWLLTFVNIRVGFGIMVLAIAVSPEFTVMGVPNIRLEDFIFPAVLIAWVVRSRRVRERLVPADLAGPLLLLIFISLVSSLHNMIYGDLPLWTSLLRLGKGIEYYLMLVVAFNVARTEKHITNLVCLYGIAAALVTGYALVQLQIQDQGTRVTGLPGETANILGGFLVFHLCLVLGVSTTSTRLRLPGMALVACMAIPFVHTLSRASYVSIFVGLCLLALLTRKRSVLLVLLMVAALIVVTQACDRFETIFGILSGDPPTSWQARVAGWQAFVPSILAAPLLGQGIGRAPLSIDNEYVRQVYELGFLGFLLFAVLVFRAGRTALQATRAAGNPILRGFAAGYLAGLVALLVHSIAATTFTTIRTTEPFFIATGLVYAIVACPNSRVESQESSAGHLSTMNSELSTTGAGTGRRAADRGCARCSPSSALP